MEVGIMGVGIDFDVYIAQNLADQGAEWRRAKFQI
jgi:hypothetical protein